MSVSVKSAELLDDVAEVLAANVKNKEVKTINFNNKNNIIQDIYMAHNAGASMGKKKEGNKFILKANITKERFKLL